jgi:excinuclease ABC subunit C
MSGPDAHPIPRSRELNEEIAAFPSGPGAYLMKDPHGRVIYVGKAKNLKSRVRQYFAGEDERYQVKFLMQRVREVDFIATRTESEALLLENSLIKKHKPKYNVFLKDDKTYLGLKLTIRDDFPRLMESRRIKKDGAVYYGPFTNAERLREVKEFIDTKFLLRTCGDAEFAKRTRPCLEYQIKRCSAPCVGYVDKAAYARQIEAVKLFLDGKSRELQRRVTGDMERAALELRFEEAARLRDLLQSMKIVLEKQNVTGLSFEFLDVIALERQGDKVGVAVLMVRESELIDSKYFVFRAMESDAESLSHFIAQYYSEDAFIPREIVLPTDIEDAAALSEMLSARAHGNVTVRPAKRGEKKDLLALAVQNLSLRFAKERSREEDLEKTLAALRTLLHLNRAPRRMECVDISHLSGKQAVGSLVRFVDGKPDKGGYRRFKIKTKDTPDDYAMMREVLGRRFSRGPETNGSERGDGKWERPDLLVVDGGLGQISQALGVLKELKIADVDVVGIAKGQGTGVRAKGAWEGKKEDEIYLPGRKNPVILRRGSPEIMMLQNLRDEAHRFAIAYHRSLREKALTRSWLDEIPGIGSRRKNTLIKAFGSPQAVAQATVDELTKIAGVTEKLAEMIRLTAVKKSD